MYIYTFIGRILEELNALDMRVFDAYHCRADTLMLTVQLLNMDVCIRVIKD